MADAMLSAAAGRLIGLIEEKARNHVNLVIGAEEEVHSLAEDLNTIRYVLDDAENRRFKDNDVNYWLSKLEHASYDMEDVLDQWNHAILKLAASPKQKVWSLIPSSACSCFKKVVVRHDIATKILDVKARLEEIHPLPKTWRDPSTSFTLVEEVHGRVLDDVWTEGYGKWERLQSYLRCGGDGSKILVTTRKTNVAKIMGTMDEDIHYPEMLSVED